MTSTEVSASESGFGTAGQIMTDPTLTVTVAGYVFDIAMFLPVADLEEWFKKADVLGYNTTPGWREATVSSRFRTIVRERETHG